MAAVSEKEKLRMMMDAADEYLRETLEELAGVLGIPLVHENGRGKRNFELRDELVRVVKALRRRV